MRAAFALALCLLCPWARLEAQVHEPAQPTAAESALVRGAQPDAGVLPSPPSAEVTPRTSESFEAASLPLSAASAAQPESELVLLTGSRIEHSAALASAAPLEIIDRKAIERAGAAYAGDLLQLLTAAPGSGFQGQGAGSPAHLAGGARGTVTINLRGLGAGSTLVLLNGRRLTPSAGSSTEALGDLGMIPLSAIERIEILKGGGSAIYGADAVGGAINVITRDAWDGARVELNGQGTTRFDQADVMASAGFGARSENSRVAVALSYLRRSQLLSSERPFALAANVEQSGNPATFVAPGLDPTNPMRSRFVDPACGKVSGSAVVRPTLNGMQSADEICSFSTAQYTALVDTQERANGLLSASYDLSSHTTIFMELLASRMRQEGALPPSFPLPPPLLSVPADHIDNPFGRSVGFQGRPLGAASGPSRGAVSEDTLRAAAGLRGDFADVARDTVLARFAWQLAASWGVSRYTSMAQHTLRAPLQAALDSCADASDLSRCFNPFFSASDGTGTPNSQAVIDSFTSLQTSLADYALHTYDSGLTGPLLALPGGDLTIALGGEYRYEWRAAQLAGDSGQAPYARAERNVTSGYLELRWPLYQGIALQTAARVEHYSDIRQTAPSPLAGVTLAPATIALGSAGPPLLRTLQVSGQVTSAFRAPALLPLQQVVNPKLEPERALVASAGVRWQPIEPVMLDAELWNYSDAKHIALDSQLTQRNLPGRIATNGIDATIMLSLSAASFAGSRGDWGVVTFGTQGTLTLSYDYPRALATARTLPNLTPVRTLAPLHCDAIRCDAVGSRNYNNIAPPLPRFRFNFPVYWSYGRHTVSAIAHWLSGLEDDNNVDAHGKLGHLAPQVTLDLQYGVTIPSWVGKELAVRIGLFNVFDTLPPATHDQNGYETLLYDPRGRMLYANIKAGF